ncbi:ATP-dependent endonuclease, partial [Acinetobacter baumannii]
MPEVEIEDSASKRSFPNHFRSLIEVLYVPAIRRPAEQLRYVSGSILYRVLRKIKWQEEFKEDFDEKINEINKSFQSLKEFTTVQNSITEFWKRFHKDER